MTRARIAAVLLAGLALAACGGERAQNVTANASQRITFWRTLTGPAGNSIDELVQRFTASQKDVRVASVFKGSYDDIATALMVSASRGTGADVALVGTFEIRQFAQAGILRDLTPLVDGPDGVDTKTWPNDLRAAGQVGDGLYWVPFNVSVPVLYLNETHLKEAGLSGPPQTWDEFFKYARLLTKRDANGKVVRHGLALWDITWPLVSAIWSEGGQVTDREYTNITFDDPITIEVTTRFQELMKEGAAEMPPQATGGQRNAFTRGLAAMILDSPAPMKDFFEYSHGAQAKQDGFRPMVAQYPQGRKGRIYAPGGGGLVMLKTDDPARVQAAWRFMKFLLEDANVAEFALNSGYIAYSQGAQKVAAPRIEQAPPLQTVQAAAQYIRGDFSINWSPGVRKALDEAVQRILIKLEDPAAVLRDEDAKAEAEVARERAGK